MDALTADQIRIVQDSWAKVKSTATMEVIGRNIFLRFFEYCPAAQNLFPFRDQTREELKISQLLAKHGANFVHYIDQALVVLDDFDRQGAPKVKALGARHYGRGAQGPHYDLAGLAFLDTLGATLGEDFTPLVKASWVLAYGVIKAVMLAGTKESEGKHVSA